MSNKIRFTLSCLLLSVLFFGCKSEEQKDKPVRIQQENYFLPPKQEQQQTQNQNKSVVDSEDADEIIAVLDKITIRLEPSEDGQRTFLNEEDVSKDIRSAEVTAAVSFVSSLPEVRRRLVAMQREFARQKSVVMDGRDIGTVVFPGADLKIYMTASIGDRAVRRAAEIEASGQKVDVDDIIRALEERDRLDQSRRESPLRKAEDAVEINTSGLSIAEQAQKIITLLEEKNLRS